jgi:hypothetical protein
MFVRVEPHELVPGTKYKVGTAKWTYVKTWDAPDGITRYEFFDMINPTFQRCRFFTSSHTFYQFVPQQPQWKMERRSVNILVRRLIGDEHFEW